MNFKHGALLGLVVALACAHPLPAQPTLPGQAHGRFTPEPINLDIPPEETPDPELERQHELAVLAIEHPEEFHEFLLQIEPGRRRGEEIAALAILYPEAVRRAIPRTPAQLRAEAVAAHAILHPRMDAVISLP